MTDVADISAHEQDVHCPLCGYNLRGLPEARCPECGGKFDFEQLRDTTKRLHPYLFEHHPEANARSFMRTMIGSLWPWTFWKNLLPVQPSFPRRIVLYQVICAVIVLLLIGARFGADVRQLAIQSRGERASTMAWIRRAQTSGGPNPYKSLLDTYGSVDKWLDRASPLPSTPGFYKVAAGFGIGARVGAVPIPHLAQLVWVEVVMLAWPWLTVLAFTIFRVTLRRARLRTTHIIRVAVYNGDVIIWMALLATPAVICGVFASGPMFSRNINSAMYSALLLAGFSIPVGLLFYTLRLWIACRKYLQIRHALATAISLQIIVALFIPASIQVIAWLLELLGLV